MKSTFLSGFRQSLQYYELQGSVLIAIKRVRDRHGGYLMAYA